MASQKRFRTIEAHQQIASEGHGGPYNVLSKTLTEADRSRVHKPSRSYRTLNSKIPSVQREQEVLDRFSERSWELEDQKDPALLSMNPSAPSEEEIKASEQSDATDHTPKANGNSGEHFDSRSQT